MELLMIVDDNKIDSFVHERLVENLGFANQTIVKNSAKEALKYFEDSDIASLPDLLLLDLNMPLMDGFGFLSAFSGLDIAGKQKSRIVVVSSSDLFSDKQKAMEHPNVIGFLSKPLTDNKLLLIEKLLRGGKR